MRRSSSAPPSSRTQSPRGIVTVDNQLPANFVRRTTLPSERLRARIIAAITNIGARSSDLQRMLGPRGRLDIGVNRQKTWLQDRNIEGAKLRDLPSIVEECNRLVESPEAGKPGCLSSAALTDKCRELDSSRRVWAGLIYEEHQRERMRLGRRTYNDDIKSHELAAAMKAITI